MSHATKVEEGARRVLQVFSSRENPSPYGLLQHEFYGHFQSDEWRITDFRAAMQFAFDQGWVALDAQFYRLTEAGGEILKTVAPTV